jgi:hypothetical protein
MPHLEFQVEEPSMEAALHGLLPRLVDERATWSVAVYRNKQRLLRELPKRLPAYGRRLRDEPHLRIVVLVDQDQDDCLILKRRLEDAAQDAGLISKSRAGDGAFNVLNRIVVSELESWLLGDVEALRACFPRLPATLDRRKDLRDPDSIAAAWEALHRILRRAGERGEVYPKIETARRVALCLLPERNRSRSFRHFCAGLEALLRT